MQCVWLNARTIDIVRYITYLKEAEKIADFLAVTMLPWCCIFEDILESFAICEIQRNRLVNCENANINTVVNAATVKSEEIQYIEDTVGTRCYSKNRLENPEN